MARPAQQEMLQGVLLGIKGPGCSLEARKLREELKNSSKVNYKVKYMTIIITYLPCNFLFFKYIWEDGEEWVVIADEHSRNRILYGKKKNNRKWEELFLSSGDWTSIPKTASVNFGRCLEI